MFENESVSQQLYTSSTISYAKFSRYGYPKRVHLIELQDKIRPLESKLKFISTNRTLELKILQFLGFKLSDFKMGINMIFFRLNRFELFEKFIADFKNDPDFILNEMKRFLIRSNWRYMMLSKFIIHSFHFVRIR